MTADSTPHRRALALLACALFVGGNPALAAPPDADAATMDWSDLRRTGAPGVSAVRELWKDRLEAAQRQWNPTATPSATVPAFTLVHAFAAAEPAVLVSILFDMFDCELPGNGPGSNLYARCPMRVVTGAAGAGRVQSFAGVCHLYVPPTKPGEGPDPAKNYTAVSLDATRTLHVRVVQFGRPVPACNGDYRLD